MAIYATTSSTIAAAFVRLHMWKRWRDGEPCNSNPTRIGEYAHLYFPHPFIPRLCPNPTLNTDPGLVLILDFGIKILSWDIQFQDLQVQIQVSGIQIQDLPSKPLKA